MDDIEDIEDNEEDDVEGSEGSEEEGYSIPDSLLDAIWECTGSGNTNTGGYLLAYVGRDGTPVVRLRAGTRTLEMGLRKVTASFLKSIDDIEYANFEDGYSF
jgi:hypothetical protein